MKPHASIVVAAAVLAASCAGIDDQEVPESSAARLADVVQLLGPGAEPRAPLRYRHVTGRSERLIVQLGLASVLETTQGAGASRAVVKVALNVGAIAPVSPAVSAYPVRLELLGIDMPSSWTEGERSALEKQLAPLSEVSGTFQVDTRGITQRMELALPPGASPRLLAMFGNLRSSLISAPFPADPVGVGARWQVERPVQVGPIEAEQIATYTLLARHEDELRIGVTMVQRAVPQEVTLQEGASLSVKAYQVSSVGSSVVKLEDVTPVSQVRGSSKLRAILKRGGQEDEAVALGGALLVNVEPDVAPPH